MSKKGGIKMDAYRVFTVLSGKVNQEVIVETRHLQDGSDIPAVVIGDGKGAAFIPVRLTREEFKEWEKSGLVIIKFASVETNKDGRLILISQEKANNDDKIICVFKTKVGWGGSNSHTGDKEEEWWELNPLWKKEAAYKFPIKEKYTEEEVRNYRSLMIKNNKKDDPEDQVFEHHVKFFPFPGEIIAKGVFTKEILGMVGSGEQLVAIIPKDVVFRTGYSGKLFGTPNEHYYKWDGEKLFVTTWEERKKSNIF